MLTSLPVTLLVGSLLGFLAGLGIGGGSLLVLWLTLVLGMSPETARGINLLFFIPSALITCGIRIREGSLNIRKVLPAVISGCVSAGIFSWLSTVLRSSLLKKGFGILLLAAGIRELFYRPRKAR